MTECEAGAENCINFKIIPFGDGSEFTTISKGFHFKTDKIPVSASHPVTIFEQYNILFQFCFFLFQFYFFFVLGRQMDYADRRRDSPSGALDD